MFDFLNFIGGRYRKRSLKLVASNFSFEFLILDPKTQSFQLLCEREGKIEDLGVNYLDKILKRLWLVLNPNDFPETPARFPDGDYTCFVMLYVKENSGYARPTERGIEFQFQNARGQPTFKLELTLQECQQWRQQIERFLS